jgi:hypothetical protein
MSHPGEQRFTTTIGEESCVVRQQHAVNMATRFGRTFNLD